MPLASSGSFFGSKKNQNNGENQDDFPWAKPTECQLKMSCHIYSERPENLALFLLL